MKTFNHIISTGVGIATGAITGKLVSDNFDTYPKETAAVSVTSGIIGFGITELIQIKIENLKLKKRINILKNTTPNVITEEDIQDIMHIFCEELSNSIDAIFEERRLNK